MPETGFDCGDARTGTDTSLWLRRHVTAETNREHGQGRAQGSPWRKPPGPPARSPVISLFPGKAAAGFSLPLRGEGAPPRRGRSADSLEG